MLSYFEAITLAPARCAQILNTSREGRSRIGRAVDARLRLARAASTRASLGARAPWPKLVLLVAVRPPRRDVAARELHPHRVRAVAGPEPPQRPRRRPRRARASTAAAPLLAKAEQRLASTARGRPRDAHDARRRDRQLDDADARAAGASASSRRSSSSAELRKELQAHRRHPRARCRIPSQQSFGVAKGSRSTSPCAAPTGTRSSPRRSSSRRSSRRAGVATDLNYRLPGRRARAADHARSRARDRARRLGERSRQHRERARRRQHRRQVHRPTDAASTCACASSPRSARARRTSAPSGCAPRAASSCRCRSS